MSDLLYTLGVHPMERNPWKYYTRSLRSGSLSRILYPAFIFPGMTLSPAQSGVDPKN